MTSTAAVNEHPVIEWVNHASFVLRAGNTRLICDPWLQGTAFNDGWRLLSPTVFSSAEFADITHIWFSHQHPDHFSPRDIRQISSADRARITVLYHKTIDKKVVRFCEGLRFKACVELEDRQWYPMSSDIEVMCGAWDDRDSWIAMRTAAGVFLNVNDCVIDQPDQAREIARSVGPVDVLFTQFSYANWAGNPDDERSHREHAEHKLKQIALQVATFKPAFVVPFASFVWFSHQENFFHNAQMNQVGDVAKFIERELGARAVVLYPGERWEYGRPHDSTMACARYRQDFEAVLQRGPVDVCACVDRQKLQRAMETFLTRLKKRNPVIRFVPGLRTSAYVTDWGCPVELSLDGLRETQTDAPVDLRVSSDSLHFALKAPWGANALAVNGRYTVPPGGDAERFFRFFRAADLNDHGRYFDYAWAAGQVVKAARRRMRAVLAVR